jgi:hypothetical protein
MAGGTPSGLPTSTWNVINNWNYHGRTVDYQNVSLGAGNYRVIMEWFEGSGDATIQLQVGTNKFSFSDSPQAGAGGTFPVVNSTKYSSSSLILNGVINLNIPTGYTSAQWKPRLEYYSLYYINGGTKAMVEVSNDGGFTWIQDNLSNNCPDGLESWWQCSPTTWGWQDRRPQSDYDWGLFSLDLSSYVNQNIGLRFRLETTGSGGTTYDGWWITDVVIGNNGA